MRQITENQMWANFAHNLRILRKTRKPVLSQKALARVLNVSEYAVNTCECQRAAPTAHMVYLVSVYFHIPMEQLLTKTLDEKEEPNCMQTIDC